MRPGACCRLLRPLAILALSATWPTSAPALRLDPQVFRGHPRVNRLRPLDSSFLEDRGVPVRWRVTAAAVLDGWPARYSPIDVSPLPVVIGGFKEVPAEWRRRAFGLGSHVFLWVANRLASLGLKWDVVRGTPRMKFDMPFVTVGPVYFISEVNQFLCRRESDCLDKHLELLTQDEAKIPFQAPAQPSQPKSKSKKGQAQKSRRRLPLHPRQGVTLAAVHVVTPETMEPVDLPPPDFALFQGRHVRQVESGDEADEGGEGLYWPDDEPGDAIDAAALDSALSEAAKPQVPCTVAHKPEKAKQAPPVVYPDNVWDMFTPATVLGSILDEVVNASILARLRREQGLEELAEEEIGAPVESVGSAGKKESPSGAEYDQTFAEWPENQIHKGWNESPIANLMLRYFDKPQRAVYALYANSVEQLTGAFGAELLWYVFFGNHSALKIRLVPDALPPPL